MFSPACSLQEKSIKLHWRIDENVVFVTEVGRKNIAIFGFDLQ